MFAADGSEAAFTRHRRRFHILPALGGPTAQVNVLDDGGIAAGIADLDANETSKANLWGPTAAAHGLGFFPGGNFSWILGTNGHGDYTGIASLSPTDPLVHVFVAHTGGPLVALPPLSGDYAATHRSHTASTATKTSPAPAPHQTAMPTPRCGSEHSTTPSSRHQSLTPRGGIVATARTAREPEVATSVARGGSAPARTPSSHAQAERQPGLRRRLYNTQPIRTFNHPSGGHMDHRPPTWTLAIIAATLATTIAGCRGAHTPPREPQPARTSQ